MFNSKKNIYNIFIFLLLLFSANLFLLKPGFWFYQDAGFWPKTNHETLVIFLQQFHIFTNLGYYIGSDQGLLSFTRILIVGFISLVSYLFKQDVSQIVFTLIGYILTFISFYIFSGIFFKDKRFRYVLSLIYVFNPISYASQGYVFYNATVPLFIYSFYKYFLEDKTLKIKYLLVNIFSAFIWVSYIRLVQGYSFIIVPYLLYLIFQFRSRLQVKKTAVYISSYFLLFSPIIFAFVSQLLEKADTAFNYGSLFGGFSVKYKMFDAFNIFQSVGTKLYEDKIWSIVGLIFFAYLTYLIVTFLRKNHSGFYLLNLSLILLGISIYGLGNIFGKEIYLKTIHLLPFVINEPYWALYILAVPLVIVIGLLTKDRIKSLYVFAFFFIAFATLPLLNLSDFQLQKYNISSIPAPYKTYFIDPYMGIPEASYYLLGDCWRAKFMDEANVPTFCPNYGHHYPPIIFNNPRVVSGTTYDISQFLYATTQVDNLRITHNLKNVFVPNDIVKTRGPGPITGNKEIKMVENARREFDENPLLLASKNQNFTFYSFTNKDKYDFFIYSPKTVIHSQNLNILTGNTLDINSRPVIVSNDTLTPNVISQNVKVEYKISPLEPYKYYLHITNIDNIHSFLIQFNQKYSPLWKIKIVSKEYFDKTSCVGASKTFPITNNSYCQYKNDLLDLGNIMLLKKQNISDSKHFQDNFTNNTWVISPQDSAGKNELYLVIVYTKQIYYIYIILIAGISLFVLVALCFVQEFIMKITKKTRL